MHDEISYRKSSYSGSQGNCVEVATVGDRVLVRNSRDRSGSVLEFTGDEWDAFLAGAREGEFSREAL